jgi:hypothetical protein
VRSLLRQMEDVDAHADGAGGLESAPALHVEQPEAGAPAALDAAAAAAAASAAPSDAEAAEDAAAAQDGAYVSALAQLQRWPPFLRACRVSRALGDATLLHETLEELRGLDPARHAALAAHAGAFLRAANRDEQPARDGSTAELRALWAFADSASNEAAAARAERDAAVAAQRATAARLDAAPLHAAGGAPGTRRTAFAPPPGVQRHKVVTWHAKKGAWNVLYWNPSAQSQVRAGWFPVGQEAAAARAYDDVARAHGDLVVNYPRLGSAETQAVFRLKTKKTALASATREHAARAGAEPASAGAPGGTASLTAAPVDGCGAAQGSERDRKRPRFAEAAADAVPAVGVASAAGRTSRPADAPRFKGLHWKSHTQKWEVYMTDIWGDTKTKKYCGTFAVGAEVEAARAYDSAVRATGGTCVNFPRAGTAETQAAPRQVLSATGFRGVRKCGRRFEARAHLGGRFSYIGSFGSAEEAARARDRFLRKAGAPQHRLNFPDAAADTSHEPPPAEAALGDGAVAPGAASHMAADGDDDDAGGAAGGMQDSDADDAAWLE